MQEAGKSKSAQSAKTMSKQEREIEELAQKIKAMAASKPTSFSHSTTREVSISAHPQSDKGSPAAAPRRIGGGGTPPQSRPGRSNVHISTVTINNAPNTSPISPTRSHSASNVQRSASHMSATGSSSNLRSQPPHPTASPGGADPTLSRPSASRSMGGSPATPSALQPEAAPRTVSPKPASAKPGSTEGPSRRPTPQQLDPAPSPTAATPEPEPSPSGSGRKSWFSSPFGSKRHRDVEVPVPAEAPSLADAGPASPVPEEPSMVEPHEKKKKKSWSILGALGMKSKKQGSTAEHGDNSKTLAPAPTKPATAAAASQPSASASATNTPTKPATAASSQPSASVSAATTLAMPATAASSQPSTSTPATTTPTMQADSGVITSVRLSVWPPPPPYASQWHHYSHPSQHSPPYRPTMQASAVITPSASASAATAPTVQATAASSQPSASMVAPTMQTTAASSQPSASIAAPTMPAMAALSQPINSTATGLTDTCSEHNSATAAADDEAALTETVKASNGEGRGELAESTTMHAGNLRGRDALVPEGKEAGLGAAEYSTPVRSGQGVADADANLELANKSGKPSEMPADTGPRQIPEMEGVPVYENLEKLAAPDDLLPSKPPTVERAVEGSLEPEHQLQALLANISSPPTGEAPAEPSCSPSPKVSPLLADGCPWIEGTAGAPMPAVGCSDAAPSEALGETAVVDDSQSWTVVSMPERVGVVDKGGAAAAGLAEASTCGWWPGIQAGVLRPSEDSNRIQGGGEGRPEEAPPATWAAAQGMHASSEPVAQPLVDAEVDASKGKTEGMEASPVGLSGTGSEVAMGRAEATAVGGIRGAEGSTEAAVELRKLRQRKTSIPLPFAAGQAMPSPPERAANNKPASTLGKRPTADSLEPDPVLVSPRLRSPQVSPRGFPQLLVERQPVEAASTMAAAAIRSGTSPRHSLDVKQPESMKAEAASESSLSYVHTARVSSGIADRLRSLQGGQDEAESSHWPRSSSEPALEAPCTAEAPAAGAAGARPTNNVDHSCVIQSTVHGTEGRDPVPQADRVTTSPGGGLVQQDQSVESVSPARSWSRTSTPPRYGKVDDRNSSLGAPAPSLPSPDSAHASPGASAGSSTGFDSLSLSRMLRGDRGTGIPKLVSSPPEVRQMAPPDSAPEPELALKLVSVQEVPKLVMHTLDGREVDAEYTHASALLHLQLDPLSTAASPRSHGSIERDSPRSPPRPSIEAPMSFEILDAATKEEELALKSSDNDIGTTERNMGETGESYAAEVGGERGHVAEVRDVAEESYMAEGGGVMAETYMVEGGDDRQEDGMAEGGDERDEDSMAERRRDSGQDSTGAHPAFYGAPAIEMVAPFEFSGHALDNEAEDDWLVSAPDSTAAADVPGASLMGSPGARSDGDVVGAEPYDDKTPPRVDATWRLPTMPPQVSAAAQSVAGNGNTPYSRSALLERLRQSQAPQGSEGIQRFSWEPGGLETGPSEDGRRLAEATSSSSVSSLSRRTQRAAQARRLQGEEESLPRGLEEQPTVAAAPALAKALRPVSLGTARRARRSRLMENAMDGLVRHWLRQLELRLEDARRKNHGAAAGTPPPRLQATVSSPVAALGQRTLDEELEALRQVLPLSELKQTSRFRCGLEERNQRLAAERQVATRSALLLGIGLSETGPHSPNVDAEATPARVLEQQEQRLACSPSIADVKPVADGDAQEEMSESGKLLSVHLQYWKHYTQAKKWFEAGVVRRQDANMSPELVKRAAVVK
ncbi:hypothetical protein CYMTET_20452 [Cymbomonas tetramitiformis]|uniref:Uncharacterized protein n=1 Tax=Cymbomonas tetramitiformis TaxID=36881 RepID=A0AAE0G405_9CHLO|nr:hypothetical protein CYMTET_20452 [Cymbomonas tetramitiformis]